MLAAGIADDGGRRLAANASVEFYVLPGDANADRIVNDLDLLQVWQNSLRAPAQQDLNADLNGDGQVTAADVAVVQSNYLSRLASVAVRVLGTQINSGHLERSRLEDATIRFSENVGPSVSLSDVLLRNLTTSQNIAPADLTLRYDSLTNTLTIALAGGRVLPAGNYRLTLLGTGVADGGGRTLDSDVVLNFHILPGDANGDRVVNDLDLYLVWQNLLRPPANRDLQFDLNRDGTVTLADSDVVRANYRSVLSETAIAAAIVTPGVSPASGGLAESATLSAAETTSADTTTMSSPPTSSGSAVGQGDSASAVSVSDQETPVQTSFRPQPLDAVPPLSPAGQVDQVNRSGAATPTSSLPIESVDAIHARWVPNLGLPGSLMWRAAGSGLGSWNFGDAWTRWDLTTTGWSDRFGLADVSGAPFPRRVTEYPLGATSALPAAEWPETSALRYKSRHRP